MQKRDSPSVAWISKLVIDEMTIEARRVFPLETGGVLLGYWANCYSEVVITNVIGPGNKAVHTPFSFFPDAEFQEKEIARLYRESGKLHTYLGDWHTHPKAAPYLSPRDKQTLRNIASCSSARAPVPLMAILGGYDTWELIIWLGYYTSWGRIRFTFKTVTMEAKIY